MAELTVVMPVYNEEGAIEGVLNEWIQALESLSIDYLIAAYNDGSKDGTWPVLERIASINRRIKVIDKPNSGHGSTILQGYRDHLDSPWIFQIDSDGELRADHFGELWSQRLNHDFLIGVRKQRRSPFPRKVMTWISRYLVWVFYGRSVYDVNCPYRLFRPSLLMKYILRIPLQTFAPNLILAGLASLLHLKIYQIDVVHTVRQTGEVSIKRWRLLKAAVISCVQTTLFRITTIPFMDQHHGGIRKE